MAVVNRLCGPIARNPFSDPKRQLVTAGLKGQNWLPLAGSGPERSKASKSKQKGSKSKQKQAKASKSKEKQAQASKKEAKASRKEANGSKNK